jgi:uncharacterized protein (TIGR02145 family)
MNKVKFTLLAAGLALAMTFTFSCSSGDDDDGDGGGNSGGYTGSYGSVSYSGKTYKTVNIGTQTWFAENLDYDPGTGNSACYDNQASNCAIYGRLYDWSTAMDVCPSGWHLPSRAEWEVMITYIGGASTDGTKLKATSGWFSNGIVNHNGTDEFGFSALPGGGRYAADYFHNVGSSGNWWSASESESDIGGAYSRGMDGNFASWNGYSKGFLFSVRCVQD